MEEGNDGEGPVIAHPGVGTYVGMEPDQCAYCLALSHGDVDDSEWVPVQPRDNGHRTRLPNTLARLVAIYVPSLVESSYPDDHERRYEVALYVLVTNHQADHDHIGGALPAASATTARAAVMIADLVKTYSPDAAKMVGILASRWIAAHERKLEERYFGT